ncbi:MAG TPA: hypothetical protein VK538_07295, partial [Solirubrobacteraceae bacterium]|nr:hypothetical protein [Solirubrobacteraceae bacterium]
MPRDARAQAGVAGRDEPIYRRARRSRMTTLVSIWLVLVLAVTASLKAWRAAGTAQALATY